MDNLELTRELVKSDNETTNFFRGALIIINGQKDSVSMGSVSYFYL